MELISPNLKLPYLAPAQAQKHVTHNEALRKLDVIVQLSVLSVVDMPPTDPQNGDCFIIDANGQGDFTEKMHHIAAFQDGAWIFLSPKAGWRSYVQDNAEVRIFDGHAWQALNSGGNSETATKFGINTAADDINRLAVKSNASLYDNEGSGHQLKINKATQNDTASLLFQSGYAGHAEMGLTGDNDFHIKTSPDGQSFRNALTVNAETGVIKTPYGLNAEVMTTPTSLCGGPDSFYGLPSASSIVVGRRNLALAMNRMIFAAVYVDREAVLQGGRVAQYGASSTVGSVMRCGLYHLGSANGNGWDLGDFIHDFGTVPADVAGLKTFNMDSPLTLSQGWYAFGVGVNGAGAGVRYMQSRQPGLGYVQPHGSGAAIDISFGGPTSYMLESNVGDEISNGLSQSWPSNPIGIFASANSYAYNIFIPKWAVFT